MKSEGTVVEDLVQNARDVFCTPFDGALTLMMNEDEQANLVDGRQDPVTITAAPNKSAIADCTIRGEADVLRRILKGERALESAYLSGRIAISGDISILARLQLSATK